MKWRGNPIVFPSLAVGLVPKVANPIDMSLALDQTVGMGDPEMPEGGDIPRMVAGQVARLDHAVRSTIR
ncbi:MAG: hypothetical protein IH977_02925 [Nitrospinae bacterium]|nr:hypothetical protein [Nitrospinota bacterium]